MFDDAERGEAGDQHSGRGCAHHMPRPAIAQPSMIENGEQAG